MAIPYCNTPVPAFGPQVKVANGNIIIPIAQTETNLAKELLKNAQHAYMFNDLATGSLISIGKLYDDNCFALFSKYFLKILKNNKVIITGKRNNNELWDILLKGNTEDTPLAITSPIKPVPVENGVICLDQTKQELAQYLSATCFGPAPSTLLCAIRKQHLNTWPGLSVNLISKYLPKSMHTAKGHLDQEAKNLRSTRTNQEEGDEKEDIEPPQEPENMKKTSFYALL